MRRAVLHTLAPCELPGDCGLGAGVVDEWEQGREQVKHTRQELRHIRFDEVYSSDLKRAVHTAEILYGKPVEASKRIYTARAMPTTEAGIRTDGLSQAYVSLGEAQDGGVAVRLYDKPLILLIWIGSLVMALGGGLSLTDRRFRLAAPKRAAPAVAAQPAE